MSAASNAAPQAPRESPSYGGAAQQKPSMVANSNYDPLDVDGNADGESINRQPMSRNQAYPATNDFAPAIEETAPQQPVQQIKTKQSIQPLTKEEIDELNKEFLTPIIENNEIL